MLKLPTYLLYNLINIHDFVAGSAAAAAASQSAAAADECVFWNMIFFILL